MENDILRLREKGYTYKQIMDELNCSKSIISYYCRRNGISRYDNKLKISDDLIEKMQLYYNECNSSRKVAKKFNISRNQVSKYIKLNSVKNSIKTEDDRKKLVVKRVILWRQRVKIKLVEYKGGSCQICGYNKCVRSLQFHHVNPMEKDYTISGKTKAFDKMVKEVDKCILVCNNCHGEIHEQIDLYSYSDIVNKIMGI